jgi:hypothetical protein
MTNVWHPLSRALPDATDVDGTIIQATSYPGYRHVIVIVNQHDGQYSVMRLNPVRENGILVWKQISAARELTIGAALAHAHGMIQKGHAVAVQMAGIEARMAEQDRQAARS